MIKRQRQHLVLATSLKRAGEQSAGGAPTCPSHAYSSSIAEDSGELPGFEMVMSHLSTSFDRSGMRIDD